jgi:hypothetical protein
LFISPPRVSSRTVARWGQTSRFFRAKQSVARACTAASASCWQTRGGLIRYHSPWARNESAATTMATPQSLTQPGRRRVRGVRAARTCVARPPRQPRRRYASAIGPAVQVFGLRLARRVIVAVAKRAEADAWAVLTAGGRRGPVTEMFCVRPAARLYCRHGGRQQLWRGRHRVRDMQASRGVPGRLRAGRDKRPSVADDRPAVPELPIGNHVGLAAVRDAGRG